MSGFIRRAFPWTNNKAHRVARGQLPAEGAPARLGTQMADQAMADGYRHIEHKQNDALLALLTFVVIMAKKIKKASNRIDEAEKASDKCKGESLGSNQVAPPLWIILAALITPMEFILGRFVVSLLAVDDGDTAIIFATLAVTATIMAVGHMAAGAFHTWVYANNDTPKEDKRFAVLKGMFTVIYIVGLGVALSSVGADLGRWVLSYMAVFSSITIQVLRPSKITVQWAFHSVDMIRRKPLKMLLSRKAMRSFRRLVMRFHEATAFWAGHMEHVQGIEAQFALDQDLPSVARAGEHQEYLVVTGLKVTFDDLLEAAELLTDAGVDVGVILPTLRRVA